MSIGKFASEEDIKNLKEKYKSIFEPFNIPVSEDILQPSIKLKITEYNHLVNERDWYKKRMEEYRDSFWRVVEIIKNNKSQIPNEVYDEVIKEYERY